MSFLLAICLILSGPFVHGEENPSSEPELSIDTPKKEPKETELDGEPSGESTKEKYPSYHVWGMSLGHPSALNLNYWYWWGRTGLKLAGMYFDSIHGAEVGLSYKLSESFRHSNHLNMYYGGMTTKDDTGNFNTTTREFEQSSDDMRYLAFTYTYAYKRFFIEPGYRIGRGDFSDDTGFHWSLGFRYRFLSFLD